MPTADELAQEAERLLSVGAGAEAEVLCQRLLERVPGHPTALMISSVIRMAAGRWGEAEIMLLQGSSLHPHIVGFHAALGRLRLQMNRHAEAVTPLENCVLLDPGQRAHRVALVALYQTRLFATFSEESRQAMIACLADETLTHSLMHKAWLSLVRLDPEAAPLLRLFDQALDYPSFARAVTSEILTSFQDDQLLQGGLRRLLAADVSIERGMTFMRRWFLENSPQRDRFFPLLCALARACFFAEYVFAASEDWSALREDLSTPAAVAMLACYEALVPAPGSGVLTGGWIGEGEAARLSALSSDPEYRDLVRTLIDEPRAELAIEPTIAALTPIDDEVSRAVRRQYEENPYPRWTTVGSAHGDEGPPRESAGARHRRILVAGCGTGREAVDAALTFPEAQVEAIDLSRASLAYGIRKAGEMGVLNLSFAQADLLCLERLPGRYDLITASGVLHHLKQPAAGLRALLAVLRPGGTMRIGLYSRVARAAVAEARRWIADAGFPPTAAGIREFRAAVMARDVSDPVRAWLTRSYDFYSLSQCRDLVFHVQEHTFTLPEVAELARALALSIIQIDIRSPVHVARYQEQFPDDPEGLNLANWQTMEQRDPTVFSGMYSLWLCRTSEQGLLDLTWMHPDG